MSFCNLLVESMALAYNKNSSFSFISVYGVCSGKDLYRYRINIIGD